MLREFVQLVNEAVDSGYSRGLDLFMESLELDLQKESIFEEHGVEGYLGAIFEHAGIEVSQDEIDPEDLDEDTIDRMIKEIDD